MMNVIRPQQNSFFPLASPRSEADWLAARPNSKVHSGFEIGVCSSYPYQLSLAAGSRGVGNHPRAIGAAGRPARCTGSLVCSIIIRRFSRVFDSLRALVGQPEVSRFADLMVSSATQKTRSLSCSGSLCNVAMHFYHTTPHSNRRRVRALGCLIRIKYNWK